MRKGIINVSGKNHCFPKFELLLTCLEGHDKCELFALLADCNRECYTDDHNEIEFSNS